MPVQLLMIQVRTIMMEELSELAPVADKVGDVEVSEGNIKAADGSVIAEATVDLAIRYAATTALATRVKGVTATSPDDGKSTYGRIQITLPEGWGPQGRTDDDDNPATPVVDDPATTDINEATDIIYTKYQSSEPNATYLSVDKSRAVDLAVGPDGKANDADRNPVALTATRDVDTTASNNTDTGWVIWVDVDNMARRQYVTLTINNLKAPELMITSY